MSILKKEVNFYCGDPPLKSGLYYCLVKSRDSGFYDDVLFYSSDFDEWEVRGLGDEVIYWMLPLTDVLYFECPWAWPHCSEEYREEMERRRQESSHN